MLSVPQSIMEEVHRLQSSGSVLFLASAPAYDKYLVNNLTDVWWRGRNWEKAGFIIEGIGEDPDTHAPELLVHFSNIGGWVEEDVLASGNYARAEINLYVVNSNCLDKYTPIYSVKLQLQKVTCTRKVVTFKVGLNSPLLLPFPSWKFHGSICQYAEFKGELCGYVGDYTTCDRTLLQCQQRGNVERFGAQLGLLGAIQNDG